MRRKYDDETRARAIARVLAGETISGVARDMGITRTCLQNWIGPHQQAVTVMAVAEWKPTLLNDVGEVLHLGYAALKKHFTLYADDEWIRNQTAQTLLDATRTIGGRVVYIMDRLGGVPAGGEASDGAPPD